METLNASAYFQRQLRRVLLALGLPATVCIVVDACIGADGSVAWPRVFVIFTFVFAQVSSQRDQRASSVVSPPS